MLNLLPLDLQETRFRMERLPKTTKTRGADKYEQISKHRVEMNQHPWKISPRTQQKTMLKNRAQKNEKISKQYSQMGAPK